MAEAIFLAHSPAEVWQVGDPIAVVADGHPWSAKERDPAKFWRVVVTGATVEQLERLLEILGGVDAEGEFVHLGNRRWRLEPSRLSGALRNRLEADGVITVSLSQARNALRDKLSGASY